jgi:intracellular sulfur oxidation DsrE/DsrF family protein
MIKQKLFFYIVLSLLGTDIAMAQWPAPKAPVIPEADGYVLIPNAAIRPEINHVYKAIFEATRFPTNSSDLLPALNNAGSELNALSVEGVPKENWKFVIVFHGPAIEGILNEIYYKAKYGVSNPNLNVLSELKREGVELFVCGQNLAFSKIDPATLTPDVKVASDALIVLMTYQNAGYALLSY